jgi:hypothetical protein
MEEFKVRSQRLHGAENCCEDGLVAVPAARQYEYVFMLVCSGKSSSMCYQNRYFRRAQNPLGKAAKDPLAQPAMAVAAHH